MYQRALQLTLFSQATIHLSVILLSPPESLACFPLTFT